MLYFLIINSTPQRTIEPDTRLKRVYKLVLNASALGALVSVSMAASAPIQPDNPPMAQTTINASQSFTVNLHTVNVDATTYGDLYGKVAGQSISLAPHSGIVLLKKK